MGATKEMMRTYLVFERPIRSWAYFFAGGVLLLVGLWGWEDGAFLAYVGLASPCVIQFLWPTTIGWALIFGLYAIGAVMYVWLLLSDIWKLVVGSRPDAFVDLDDSAVFLVLTAVVLAVAWGLYRVRPRRPIAVRP